MTPPLVLAVDGGNSKTDLALVRASGEVLALVRGPQSSPYHLGVDGCLQVLDDLLARAMREAGLPNGRRPVADIGELLLAGVDFPIEEEEVHTAAAERRLAARITVGNDTFAVLRAGTEKGWGVAVVCGHGINCIGVGVAGVTGCCVIGPAMVDSLWPGSGISGSLDEDCALLSTFARPAGNTDCSHCARIRFDYA